jgi:LmbE family N-acetylglucosaminyl deacetylase
MTSKSHIHLKIDAWEGKERMNVLAIGAHPDDIELGCGGLALKAVKNGHNLYMYTLSRGEASGDPALRTKELVESSRRIGAKRLWVDNFADTRLVVGPELINHIETFIDISQADLVITHSLNDTHHDHRAIASSTIEAGRFSPTILSYEIPLTKDFRPQTFYDISDVIDEKVAIIELFKTQRNKIYLDASAIRGLAEYRSLQSRLHSSYQSGSITHVEAFEVLKMCINPDFALVKSWPSPDYVPRMSPSREILQFQMQKTVSKSQSG